MIQIKDFPDYFIDKQANIYSNKYNKLKLMKQYRSSSGNGYFMIDLRKDGKKYKKLVHRLVAENFIPNPNNLPVVDHKNDDITINSSNNLQWSTQQDNIHKSYKTLDQTRNFRECYLYKDNIFIKKFKSITEACKYANVEYRTSISTLTKYKKTGNIELKYKQ